MRRYGYLEAGPSDSEALYDDTAIERALRRVQKFGALSQTGQLDEETMKLLKSPRCGNKDVDDARPRRQKRYVIGSAGWRKRELTYSIENWTHKLGNKTHVEAELKKAFAAWSRYSRLRFVRADPGGARGDISVAFGRYAHGDNYPFDGPGFVLAHAYYPYEFGSSGGDVHFDEDEAWDPSDPAAASYSMPVDFFTVAVHEIGHSLGLSHSPDKNSIMFPYYKGKEDGDNFNVGYDDILAMFELYAQRSFEDDFEDENGATTTSAPTVTSTIPTTTTSAPTYDYDYEVGDYEYPADEPSGPDDGEDDGVHPEKGICGIVGSSAKYAFTHLRGELFLFRGKKMWRFSDRAKMQPGYPADFELMFGDFGPNVTGIDAMYERPDDGRIVIFSGSQFWVYDGYNFVEDSPRHISDLGLPVNLSEVDAAFVWDKNGKTYIFRHGTYWRLDEKLLRVEEGYPLQVEDRWRGIPNDVDAAFTYEDGVTYFFKGNQFWRFNDDLVKAEDDQNPNSVTNYWLGC